MKVEQFTSRVYRVRMGPHYSDPLATMGYRVEIPSRTCERFLGALREWQPVSVRLVRSR